MTKPRSVSYELKSLIQLALPITFGQLAQTANGFIDTLMAGRVSAVDLAAVALGSSLWVPVYLFMSGILLATTPAIAPLFGAREYHKIPSTVHQSVWLGIIIGVASFFAVKYAPILMQFMDVEPELQDLTRRYLDGLAWGMPAVSLFVVLRAFSDAISHTKPMMIISIIGLLANIPLNYIFIFGKLGVPAMGGAGCGWATAIVMWLMMVLMVFHVHKGHRFKNFRVFNSFTLPNFNMIFGTFKLGLPIGFAIFFEVSIFSLIALLISSLGATTMASHQVALNFASLTFMIPLSIAMALTVRVGQFVGQKNQPATQFTCQVGLALTFCIAVVISLCIGIFRHLISDMYTDDSVVIELASVLLLYAALFQISDGLQAAANGALRGFKDTTVPMYITMVAYWGVGLPIGYCFGVTSIFGEPMGAPGFWIGLCLGLTAAAILLNFRLYRVLKESTHGKVWKKVLSQV